jgi:lysylphosphatidylglycerol synthetase-like protein (DUF2156 family)
MPAPELTVALPLLGFAALALAIGPILRAASGTYRRAVVRGVVVTPVVALVGGGAWIVLTASPPHLQAVLAGDAAWMLDPRPFPEPPAFVPPGETPRDDAGPSIASVPSIGP